MSMTKERKKKDGDPDPASETDSSIGADWHTRSVRFPPDLYERIVAHSKLHRRSTQLHIVWLLEQALKQAEAD